MSLLLRISFFCGVAALALPASGSTTENYFTSGIEAYEQGDYETAKAQFVTALETNETAAARHNLALTELELDQPAEAVWQLERALLLAPFNSGYHEKLNLIRQQLGLSSNTSGSYMRFSRVISFKAWTIVATISFWLLLAVFILTGLNKKRVGIGTKLLSIFSLLLLMLSLAAIWQNFRILKSGIVLSEETVSLHAAPASATPENGFARPGERAYLLDQYNGFYQIKTEGSATGWISGDSFRLLIN